MPFLHILRILTWRDLIGGWGVMLPMRQITKASGHRATRVMRSRSMREKKIFEIFLLSHLSYFII